MHERFVPILTTLSRPAVAIGGSLAIGTVVVGLAWYAATSAPSGAYVRATVGSITQEVDVSGAVKAVNSTDLAFQTSGRVAAIHVAVGDHVDAWQTLAVLDTSTQAAAIALAKANLEAQQAKLNALTAGTRPEQLAINQTAVAQAKNALVSAIQSAYASADDAVHKEADQAFTTPRSTAVLIVTVPNVPLINNPTQTAYTLVNRVQMERNALEPLFVTWNTALMSTTVDTESLAASSEANLQSIETFLNDLTTALTEAVPGSGATSPTALAGYQASVSGGLASVSGALSGLIAADTAYKAAVGALTLAQAGATANDIAAQTAAVDAAQAGLDAAQAAASQAVIVAPVSGTITAQNANLGETAVPGVPLISMIADGKYEADAQVSEADIAKVKAGDKVEVTFAAYPYATFDATVTTVNPAATMSGGVASYGITVTFVNDDERLKPGLSANLHIITATKDAALLVPASAIITNGDQKFVYVKNANGSLQVPVTTGIESANGMIEITSGLSAGDNVLSL